MRQVQLQSFTLLNFAPMAPPINTKGIAAILGPSSRNWVSSCVVPGNIVCMVPMIGVMASPGVDVMINIT